MSKKIIKHINEAYKCEIVPTEDGYIRTHKIDDEEDKRAYNTIESGSYMPEFALIYKRDEDSEWEIGGYHLPELNMDNVVPLFDDDGELKQIRGVGTAMYIDAYDKGSYREELERVRYPDAVGFWEKMGCWMSTKPYDDKSFVDMQCYEPTIELRKSVKNCLK